MNPRREHAKRLRELAGQYDELAARAEELGCRELAEDTREAGAWLLQSAGRVRNPGRLRAVRGA